MSYNALVLQVMIASPSDVEVEREVAKRIIIEWNFIHSSRTKTVLLPVSWETHSYPQLGKRPQQIINEQVLDQCDLLVGIFWTRLGTPTGKSDSGTVEEIERHIKAGKHVMLYFSTNPVSPDSIDIDQYSRLKHFIEQMKDKGLYETYESISEFSEKFNRNLNMKILNDQRLVDDSKNEVVNNESYSISVEAKQILVEASKSKDGVILRLRTFSGLTIQTNLINFVSSNEPRVEATWDSAMEELVSLELIQSTGHNNEIYKLTKLGYQVADKLSLNGDH